MATSEYSRWNAEMKQLRQAVESAMWKRTQDHRNGEGRISSCSHSITPFESKTSGLRHLPIVMRIGGTICFPRSVGGFLEES
ncbi:hypothetical protein CSUI_010274 [Cystoisospora suis]|uniref:Uncharacterized protein n=1 Tax=Cystoisospora suis TaxID=483139 RepID=A0A2C6KHV2_9APIC|nr:hypothetical protein CSUI_010274 [Cystoisospora suis]